jgi:hypothetical protein
MPYVLRHRDTGEIAAAIMKNVHDLDYFGVKWWAAQEEAEAERDAWLAGREAGGAADWEVVRMDESRIRLMNVKLKNDPAFMILVHPDGSMEARRRN